MLWRGNYYYNTAWNVDTTFRMDLGNTVTMILFSTPVILIFSLIIALLLNNKFPLRTFFRVIFFFPVVVMSGPAISELLTAHSLNFSERSPTVFEFLKLLPAFAQKPVMFVLENLARPLSPRCAVSPDARARTRRVSSPSAALPPWRLSPLFSLFSPNFHCPQ